MALIPIARILAGLGLIAWVGLAVTATQFDELGTVWVILCCSASIAIGLWMWLDRHQIDRALRSRQFQQSGLRLSLTALVALAAIGVNTLAQQHDTRWDLTSIKRHAISPSTIAIVEALPDTVNIHGFFPSESADQIVFEDLISSYQQHSTNLVMSTHDPVRDAVLADQYQVDSSLGTVILTMGERTQRIEADVNEESLTNALIRLTSSVEHTICSTEGHGEIDPDDDMNPAAFSAAITKLEQQNYTIRKVNLARTGAVPKDCSLLLIADPRTNFTPSELTTLDDHVMSGGQTLVLLDPGHSPSLATGLANYGVDVGENLVLEKHPQFQLMGGDESYLVVGADQMTDHPITRPITGMVLLRVARTIQALQPPMDGFDVGELFLTSEHAYAETQIDGSVMPKRDPEDPAGKLGLAVASEHTNGGRLVVFGDSDFTSNELLDQASNYDLLPNSIAWLVDETAQVSIRPTALSGGFAMSAMQGILLWLMSILVIPALALGGAITTWLKRRNR